jgi:hypothetical protein
MHSLCQGRNVTSSSGRAGTGSANTVPAPGTITPHDEVQSPGLHEGENRTMSSSSYTSQISLGDEVYGSDGDKVGTVAEIQPTYIVVEKGFFFPTDYYIPTSAIASASGGQVYLSTTKDAALNSGWDTVPDVQTTTMTAGATATATGDEEIRVPVMEEELTATVREQEAGAVRIERRVVDRPASAAAIDETMGG